MPLHPVSAQRIAGDLEALRRAPVLDPFEAMKPGAPAIHPEISPNNVLPSDPVGGPDVFVDKGDVDRGLSEAEVTVDGHRAELTTFEFDILEMLMRAAGIKLRHLHVKFHGATSNGRSWDPTIPTMTRSLIDGELRLNRIIDVLYRGVKPMVAVTMGIGRPHAASPDAAAR